MADRLPQTRRETRPPFLDGTYDEQTLPLPGSGATPVPVRPQRWRRRIMLATFVLMVLLPTALGAVYFGLIASDQYVVEMRFAVRSTSQSPSNDVLGLVAGLPVASSAVTDSYIVIDHMMSREMVDKLQAKTGLHAIFSRADVDYFSRFDAMLSVEEFLKYWRKMVKASFDATSQVVTVEARAFAPGDAKAIADTILALSEELVNDLSATARADAVKQAQQEVKRMEDRLRSSRTAVRAFRDTQQEFDPAKKVESRYAILGKLEEDLTKSKARLANLRSFMGSDAPNIKVLNSEIAALERQLEEERAKLGNSVEAILSGRPSIGGLAASYEELVVDREFAEKAYLSALASLERARIEADRQQRYLAAFVRPSLPQEALHPRRVLASCTVFGVSVVLWALGVLVVYAIRDHAF